MAFFTNKEEGRGYCIWIQ